MTRLQAGLIDTLNFLLIFGGSNWWSAMFFSSEESCSWGDFGEECTSDAVVVFFLIFFVAGILYVTLRLNAPNWRPRPDD